MFLFTPPDQLHEEYSNYETSVIQPIQNMRGGFPVNSISIGFPSTDKSLLSSGHSKPQIFKWNPILRSDLSRRAVTEKWRKSDEITNPFEVSANLTLILVSRANICRIIDYDPLNQLNSISCFPHRDTSGKFVSRDLDLHWLPAYHFRSMQTDPGFEFPMSQNRLGTAFQ